ncbi:MAG: hypothetical protein EAX86_01115 [Candidatus Heimdallarchaeota archaeon]|nr:hypothetical protein [Candidatus Heimdallarchaeota archaeon]
MNDLRKILIDLRDTGILNESTLIQFLDDLKTSDVQKKMERVPFIDIFGVVFINKEIQSKKLLIHETETRIKKSVKEWETGNLDRERAKEIISNYVRKKEFYSLKQNQLNYRLNLKLKRLSNIEKENSIDIEDFINQISSEHEFASLKSLFSEFARIWQDYSLKSFYKNDLALDTEILNEVELEILESLKIPIKDESDKIFDLEEMIKPFSLQQGVSSIISTPIQDIEESKDLIPPSCPSVEDQISEQIAVDLWDFVGRVAFDIEGIPLGLFRPPVRIDDRIYIPIVQEAPLDISILKKKYYDSLRRISIDLKSITTQELTAIISQALNIPEKISLIPSIFNQWLTQSGVEASPIKPNLTKAWFLEDKKFKNPSLERSIVNNEALEVLKIPAWIPAAGRAKTNESIIGNQIKGMAGSNFGRIAGLINASPYGQAIIIKRPVPPSYLLDIFLEGLAKQNLADLRFSIAKKLNIGEGNAFSPENLWLLNNIERLLVSPHEILTSYYCVLPTSAFIFLSDEVHAKIGVYFHSVPETFRYLLGKKFITQDEETGIIYGFTVIGGNFYILGTFKQPEDIIREIGRKSSPQYISRFQKRVSLALGIPYSESLNPSNLARYFLNFIWIEENLPLMDALKIIERQFTLKQISFSDITSLHADGIECTLQNG